MNFPANLRTITQVMMLDIQNSPFESLPQKPGLVILKVRFVLRHH